VLIINKDLNLFGIIFFLTQITIISF